MNKLKRKLEDSTSAVSVTQGKPKSSTVSASQSPGAGSSLSKSLEQGHTHTLIGHAEHTTPTIQRAPKLSVRCFCWAAEDTEVYHEVTLKKITRSILYTCHTDINSSHIRHSTPSQAHHYF